MIKAFKTTNVFVIKTADNEIHHFISILLYRFLGLNPIEGREDTPATLHNDQIEKIIGRFYLVVGVSTSNLQLKQIHLSITLKKKQLKS